MPARLANERLHEEHAVDEFRVHISQKTFTGDLWFRPVLEAEVVGTLLSDDSRLAPRARSEAGEGRVALVPLNDQLLEVARALTPHMQRGARLEELVQRIIADPLRQWEVVRVPGREITHDERCKLLLQGGGLFPAGWRGGVDMSTR